MRSPSPSSLATSSSDAGHHFGDWPDDLKRGVRFELRDHGAAHRSDDGETLYPRYLRLSDRVQGTDFATSLNQERTTAPLSIEGKHAHPRANAVRPKTCPERAMATEPSAKCSEFPAISSLRRSYVAVSKLSFSIPINQRLKSTSLSDISPLDDRARMRSAPSGGNLRPRPDKRANISIGSIATVRVAVSSDPSSRLACPSGPSPRNRRPHVIVAISITEEAHAAITAIKATLPDGADALPPQPDHPHGVRVWLATEFVNQLGRMRGQGETYSDVILRLRKATS